MLKLQVRRDNGEWETLNQADPSENPILARALLLSYRQGWMDNYHTMKLDQFRIIDTRSTR